MVKRMSPDGDVCVALVLLVGAGYPADVPPLVEAAPLETVEAVLAWHRPYTGDAWTMAIPIDIAGMELTVGVMWALSDFTAENGGTRVVLPIVPPGERPPQHQSVERTAAAQRHVDLAMRERAACHLWYDGRR